MKAVILASQSPRRKELLSAAGVLFTVMASDGEERITEKIPADIVKELSLQKARSIAAKQKPEKSDTILVIGADTIVVYRDEILGKPKSRDDVVRTLRMLSGNTHQVYTGVSLLLYRDGVWSENCFSECTDVTFYPVSDEKIAAYADTQEPYDKAGSYAIQGKWGIYVKGIRGDYNTVVGLPVSRIFHETEEMGIDLTRMRGA